MKCKICGHKTDWDSSYGRECFIVCPFCHKRMTKVIKQLQHCNCLPETLTGMIILEIGFIKEEERKKK